MPSSLPSVIMIRVAILLLAEGVFFPSSLRADDPLNAAHLNAARQEFVAQPLLDQDDPLHEVFRKPLAAEEQLIFLNIRRGFGRGDEVVFLARAKPGGGFESPASPSIRKTLREHWQRVLRSRLDEELQRLDAVERGKLEAAIDLTVTRIVRDFDLLCGLRDLGVEPSEYQPLEDKLRRIGLEGPWNFDPLIGRVIKQIQSAE